MSSHACRPLCFCLESATLIPTAGYGLVYECHYTDTTVWNYYPVDSQKLAGTFWSNVASPTSSCATQERPHTGHEESGLSIFPAAALPQSSSTTATNEQLTPTTRPRICGFHFHAQDWASFAERFRQASFKSSQKNLASNVYYSQHYQALARDFPEEHYAIVLMARAASCPTQLASVAHWLGWEAALDYPKLFGEPPNCYCNRPMTLCWLCPDQRPPGYFCHQRQKANIGGCSRFVEQKPRSLRQPLQPCHPLFGVLQNPKTLEGRAAAHHSRTSSSGLPVAQSAIKVWNCITTGVTDKLVDGVDEGKVISRETQKQSQPMDPSAEWLSGQGTTERAAEPDASGSDDLQQKLALGKETLAKQAQRRAIQSAIRKKVIEDYHKSKNALELWAGSVERLKAKVQALEQLGYNNPELKCVACHEGPIDYAMLPCFHMAMCSTCICELKSCVLCKATIKGVQRVYWG